MEIKIKGMMCNACAARVERALYEAGATDVSVNLSRGRATFNANKKALITFIEAVEEAGFEVVN